MKINYCEKSSTYFKDIEIGTAFSVFSDFDAQIYLKIPDVNPFNDTEWYSAFCLNNNTFMLVTDNEKVWVRDIEVLVHS